MIPASIYPDADVLTGALRVLGHVDALPASATGVLTFPQRGSILVESGRICWAAASSMQHRLTDLLRHQRSPPLDRRFLEDVLLACQAERRPLGEALLASGEISEPGLRTALFRQTVEAIAHLGRVPSSSPEFRARESAAYDARFLFTTAEVYSALGARRDRVMAITARRHIEAVATPDTTAIGFSRDDASFPHPPLAASNGGRYRVDELRSACAWAAGVLDLVATLQPDALLVMGAWGAGGNAAPVSAVAWKALGLHFVALCQSRAASAVLTSRVAAAQRSAP